MSGRQRTWLALLAGGMMLPVVLLWMRATSSGRAASAVSLVDNALVSTACVAAALTPFMGNLTVNIILPVPSKAVGIGSNICTATADVPSGVNGETSLSVVSCGKTAGTPISSVDVNTYPTASKLAGYTCNTVLPAELRLTGDGGENTVIDISVQALADTVYNSAFKVDLTTGGRVIYGTGGLASATKISNGGNGDQDGVVNNEIVNMGDTGVFGPVVRIFLRVVIFNFNVGGNTQEEIRVRYVV